MALVLALALLPPAHAAQAQEIATDLAARLTPAQQQAYLAHRIARSKFEREHRDYWSKVEAKRDARKARRLLGQAYTVDDYVARRATYRDEHLRLARAARADASSCDRAVRPRSCRRSSSSIAARAPTPRSPRAST